MNDNIFIDVQNKQLIINTSSPKGISWEDLRLKTKDKVIEMGKDYIKEKSYDLIQKYGKTQLIKIGFQFILPQIALEKTSEKVIGATATKSIGFFVSFMAESLSCGQTLEEMNSQASQAVNNYFKSTIKTK